jgi:uncharacterized membrane protein YebE (DUF533 family)
MLNARDLLGQLMQSGMADSSSDRLRHAMGSEGLGRQDNPLGQLLQGLGGGAGGGGLGSLAEMAQGMFGQAKGSVQSGNPLAIGGLAALAGALLGGGGGAARGAIGGGALALLGTLAMQALRSRQQQSTRTDTDSLAREAPLGLREPQNASEEQELEQRALLIVRAMVNAAKADGQIDGQEVERISAKLGEAGSDQEARAFLAQELQKPIDSDAITRQISDPELAVQVYAASLLAIEVDTAAERAYLRDLAARLGLDASAVTHVHQALGVAAPA